MMRAGYSTVALFVCVAAAALHGVMEVCHAVEAEDVGLKTNYYDQTCREAEDTVRAIIEDKVRTNPALAPKLLMMHFHDCFVRGCDASLLLDTVEGRAKAEKEALPNAFLKESGFQVIDEIKAAVEKICPGVVSCADILALAARDAVSAPYTMPLWGVPLGRRDGNTSVAEEANSNIPAPNFNFTTLLQIFNSKGLNDEDLVYLSGAHTIGTAHCVVFLTRLYNFTGKGDADPSLDPTYADMLRKKCPNPSSPALTVGMDPNSSTTFDKHYYENLLQNKGLFESDAALLTDRKARGLVRSLARQDSNFPLGFGRSMERMGAIQVLTGNAGEIRQNCRVVNRCNSLLDACKV